MGIGNSKKCDDNFAVLNKYTDGEKEDSVYH